MQPNDVKMRIDQLVTASGMVGAEKYDISDESKIRVVVENCNAGNTIVVRGRIQGQANFVNLKTITGLANETVNVSTYDEVQIECTVYDPNGSFIKVLASSFNDAGGSAIETIGVPSGANLTDFESFSFISSDNSVSITGNNTLKTIDLKVAAASLANLQQIYIDSVAGDDISGTGSAILPVQTLHKAVTLVTNPALDYVFVMAPGQYTGIPLALPGNVSMTGINVDVMCDVSLTPGVGDEIYPKYQGVSFNNFTMDLSAANVALPVFFGGSYSLTRLDATTGAHFVQIYDGTVVNLDLTGNCALNNVLFVGTCEVQQGGGLICSSSVIGIAINAYGSAQISLTGCTFSGSITGNTVGLFTPTVTTDSSSLSYMGTITNCDIIYSDNAQNVSYSPATPADWDVVPSKVKDALDEAASKIKRYTDSFVVADWTGPSGGAYSFTVLESAHNKGVNPTVQVYELIGGDYFSVDLSVSVDNLGNVILSVPSIPDLRFDGIVIIK